MKVDGQKESRQMGKSAGLTIESLEGTRSDGFKKE